MAWFVRHPPPCVRVVSFFITARWAGASPAKVKKGKNGAKTYSYAGSVTTATGGAFTKRFTASKSCTWQARYAGSTVYVAAVSATATVTVR
jgi:hypothetical protein